MNAAVRSVCCAALLSFTWFSASPAATGIESEAPKVALEGPEGCVVEYHRDEEGNLLPADIEFAFKNGKLALLQIRPFVENKSAQRNQYLSGLDAGLELRSSAQVDLSGIPKES